MYLWLGLHQESRRAENEEGRRWHRLPSRVNNGSLVLCYCYEDDWLAIIISTKRAPNSTTTTPAPMRNFFMKGSTASTPFLYRFKLMGQYRFKISAQSSCLLSAFPARHATGGQHGRERAEQPLERFWSVRSLRGLTLQLSRESRVGCPHPSPNTPWAVLPITHSRSVPPWNAGCLSTPWRAFRYPSRILTGG